MLHSRGAPPSHPLLGLPVLPTSFIDQLQPHASPMQPRSSSASGLADETFNTTPCRHMLTVLLFSHPPGAVSPIHYRNCIEDAAAVLVMLRRVNTFLQSSTSIDSRETSTRRSLQPAVMLRKTAHMDAARDQRTVIQDSPQSVDKLVHVARGFPVRLLLVVGGERSDRSPERHERSPKYNAKTVLISVMRTPWSQHILLAPVL